MVEEIEFIINKCPTGLIIFKHKMDIIYCNRKASSFLKCFELPEEIKTISRRIFDAIRARKLGELFPGEIYFRKKLNGSASNWLFRIYIYEKTDPLVYVLIFEETVSNKLDMNGIRQEFKLTRRETDILRLVLDGYKNTEIAVELEISEQTVKDHLSNIYSKTGTENRMAIMRKLIYSPDNQFGSQL
ncbi:MAG: LuxR family transcriptional regulator [Nitrospirae bacterium]|nr:LuxR family transcriptional regulator [Nitrospirota bacterium]